MSSGCSVNNGASVAGVRRSANERSEAWEMSRFMRY